MTKAIGIFGLMPDDLTLKILETRKKIHEAGWDIDDPQTETLPHLTLCINKEFGGDVEIIKDYLAELSGRLRQFSLPVSEIQKTEDGNLAAFFDNFFSRNLAKMVSEELEGLELSAVETWYMKLIRSVVKELHREEVESVLHRIVPEKLVIEKLVIAEGMISSKDIVAEYILK